MENFQNLNPHIYESLKKREELSPEEIDLDYIDQVDKQEIYDLICSIRDPEHLEMSLEQLRIVHPDLITVIPETKSIYVQFTPTIPNCSMSSLIGLCIKIMLTRCFPTFKIYVKIEPGTHIQEVQINKQLADKERVCAALEGQNLLKIVNRCLDFPWASRSPYTWIDKYNLLQDPFL